MDCETCGAYTRYRDFCGHWLCDRCAEDEDEAVERAQQRQIDRWNDAD
jgi:hypothetical protein